MEISEQEYNDLHQQIAEQKLQIAELRGKDIDEQIKEHIAFRRRQAQASKEKCDRVRSTFK